MLINLRFIQEFYEGRNKPCYCSYRRSFFSFLPSSKYLPLGSSDSWLLPHSCLTTCLITLSNLPNHSFLLTTYQNRKSKTVRGNIINRYSTFQFHLYTNDISGQQKFYPNIIFQVFFCGPASEKTNIDEEESGINVLQ